MAILGLNKLCFKFLENPIIIDASFTLEAKSKTGLVGINGAGKTTLFKILTGEYAPTDGEINIAKNTKIGIMEQTLTNTSNTLEEELLSIFENLSNTEKELEQINWLLEQADADHEKLVHRQMILNENFMNNGGLTYKSRVRATLMGLGFGEDDFKRPISQLSGGQRSKLALAKLLLSDADILLLDEPTNHLDIESLEWLEDFLANLDGTFIVISHDRFFLDRVTNNTINLENRKMKLYKGNYSTFRVKYEQKREIAIRHNANVEREIDRIEGIIEQQKRWNREKNLVTARSKAKVVVKLQEEIQTIDDRPKELDFNFLPNDNCGNDVLTLKNIAKSFPSKTICTDLNFELFKSEKAFLLGANGEGKTTLFRMITGEVEPDDGSLIHGANVKIGYFDQIQKLANTNATIMNDLRDTYPKMTETHLRTALATFLFNAEDIEKSCSVLSGGEKARLGLLKIMLAGVNLLLLDEPTNHLDIASREALEQALYNYNGTIFAISHDRYFINKLASRIIVLENQQLTNYQGDYDYYQEKRAEKAVITDEISTPQKADSQNKLDYQAKKELTSLIRKLTTKSEKLEAEIATLEEETSDLEAELATEKVATDYALANEINEKLMEKQDRLLEAMEEWEETLSELEIQQAKLD